MPSQALTGELVAAGTNLFASAHASTLTISGQLCGNPDMTQTFSSLPFPPTALVAADETTQTGSPSAHVCFIDGNHDLYCLGPNTTQQVSTVSTDCVTSPSPIAAVDTGGWKQVTVNTRHSCALETNGTLYCWGQNDFGELGLLADQSPPPTAFSDPRPWAEVSLGEHHACGIAAQDSNIYCWGLNVYGEAGDGERFHEHPTAVQF